MIKIILSNLLHNFRNKIKLKRYLYILKKKNKFLVLMFINFIN